MYTSGLVKTFSGKYTLCALGGYSEKAHAGKTTKGALSHKIRRCYSLRRTASRRRRGAVFVEIWPPRSK